METEKTNSYNNFIKYGLEYFLLFLNKTIELSCSKEEIASIKENYHADFFDLHYCEFMIEFEENVIKYQDKKIIYYYLEDCFKGWLEWDMFLPDIEREIIKNKYEVEFLLKLKMTLETNIDIIKSFIYLDTDSTDLSLTFEESFYNAMIRVDPDYEITFGSINGKDSGKYFEYDTRFDFECIKFECVSRERNREKIQFIEDRLIEFSQWQVEYDEVIYEEGIGSYRPSTAKYYSNFEELCRLELERLRKKVEYEKEEQSRLVVASNPELNSENKSFALKWNATDTDLLELITAFHRSNIIVRSDKKEMKRKDLIDFFSQLFDMEIKDVEVKLTRATNRKMSTTPFLDKLKLAFENYVQEKEEKQLKRK
jgi:hypothetical protein